MRQFVPDPELRFQLEEHEANQEAVLPPADLDAVRQAVLEFQNTGKLDDKDVDQLDNFLGAATPEEEAALADSQTIANLRAYVQERMADL